MRDDPPAEKREHATRADGVREVPDGLLRGELVGREPLRKRLHAGAHAHALEVAVDHPDHAHHPHERGGERKGAAGRGGYSPRHPVAAPERKVDARADEKPDGHHLARAVAVREDAVREAREAVDDAVEREEGPELDLGDAELAAEKRHRQRQVLADDVVEGVAAHRHQQRLPLPPAQALPRLRHVRSPTRRRGRRARRGAGR